VLQRLGRRADAIAAYDRALAIRPKFAAALSNRAMVLKDAGRHEDALADVDAALTLAPEQTEAVITRANVLLDLGSRQEAELNYRRARLPSNR
jgi:tetratricopeptide (TPR) repeat protein